jgi:phosphoglycolate phosphatase
MRTVVFDLDGTLADTSGDLLAAANACFAAMGHEEVLDKADALVAFQGGRAMLRFGFERLGIPWDEDEVSRQYIVLIDAYSRAIDLHTRLYPGVEPALRALHEAGFATAICTNKPEALAEALVSKLGLRPLFGALVGADTLPQRKPDPAPYFEALRRVGGDPARSFLIGDTETDALTARAAGVPIALVGFGPEGPGVARLKPDAMLDHFDDLLALAEKLCG